jgi:DNA invertase Pin-like site-specific DNA recombinase
MTRSPRTRGSAPATSRTPPSASRASSRRDASASRSSAGRSSANSPTNRRAPMTTGPAGRELIAEARDRQHRRFDGVALYSTSRLSRDRVSAGLLERELRKLVVSVVYAHAGGDSSTPEGELTIGVLQVIDQLERSRLKRENRRGMRQNALAGYRNGGRAPYGYKLKHEPHTNPIRAAAGETKSRLAIDPDEAPIVREIFMLWTTKELGVTAIADLLNEHRVPCPTATNPRLNATRRWAKATINAMLVNPVYAGRQVWDRRDNATRREQGISAPWRSEDEWTVCENAHEPDRQRGIVRRRASACRAQTEGIQPATNRQPRAPAERHGPLRHRTPVPERLPSSRQRPHVLPLHVRPALRQGRYRRHRQPRDDLQRPRGRAAPNDRTLLRRAAVRVDAARSTARAAGPTGADKRNRSSADGRASASADHRGRSSHRPPGAGAGARDRARCRPSPDRETEGREGGGTGGPAEARDSPRTPRPGGGARSGAPFSERLRDADNTTKRALFDAFDLRVVYDKTSDRLSISATLIETVASMLRNGLQPRVVAKNTPGVGLEPTTLRLTAECSAD